MAVDEYRPGEHVPESGVYRVLHDKHRAPHEVTLFRNEQFPPCAQCGQSVRFRLAGRAAAIGEDADFRQ